MKERPILFSAPMVRALLAGTKTQTRRVIKRTGSRVWTERMPNGSMGWMTNIGHAFGNTTALSCPYGQPGDRLYCREAFAFTDAHEPDYEGSIEYRADNKVLAVQSGETFDVPHRCDPRPFAGPWKPGIHMPRWASRITLEVTAVRVERLQDISEADARAEGYSIGAPPCRDDPKGWYRHLWEQINGPGSWDANPWVWCVSFSLVTRDTQPQEKATAWPGVFVPTDINR